MAKKKPGKPARRLKLLQTMSDLPLAQLEAAVAQLRAPMPVIREAQSDLGTFCGLEGEHYFTLLQGGGFSEAHFRDFVPLVLRPDDVALDVGANLGTHSLLMAGLLPEGRVLSFEPQSVIYGMLCTNMLRNGARNVQPLPFALSDRGAEVVALHLPTHLEPGWNSGIAHVEDGSGLGDRALTLRLDDLPLDRLDFVKLDVQGSETRALTGGQQTIARFRPLMFVEVEEGHLRKLGTSSKELMELILGWDYTLFRVCTDYPCDHICVPNERSAAFAAEVLPRFPYRCEEIRGRRVELTFAKPKAQTYDSIRVSP
jgi:FkbM family methyltransferase